MQNGIVVMQRDGLIQMVIKLGQITNGMEELMDQVKFGITK